MNSPTTSSTGAALEVRDLTRTYGAGAGAVTALEGVDLAFAPGTFTAVMGPSGSGKSTFLSCASGLERPTAGRVLVDGHDITDWSEDERTRLRRERIGFAIFTKLDLPPAPDDNRRVLAVLAWLEGSG